MAKDVMLEIDADVPGAKVVESLFVPFKAICGIFDKKTAVNYAKHSYTSFLEAVVHTQVLELFDNKTVQSVLYFKWKAYHIGEFYIEFAIYLISLSFVIALVFLRDGVRKPCLGNQRWGV